jgi:hypothetical protein
MGAKRSQTWHGRALAAFIKGQITREEYQMCVRGEAYVEGAYFIYFGGFRPKHQRRTEYRRRIMGVCAQ